MARYFTRASKLTGLSDLAPDRANLESHMRSTGIDPEALRLPEMTIDYPGFRQLLHDCATEWAMPDLGIRMAQRQGIELLGPVALIVRMERNVGAALRAICENLVIHSNAMGASVDEQPDCDIASIVLDLRTGTPERVEYVELILAQTKIVLEAVAETDLTLVEASFRHATGPSERAVAAFFGCPIRYDSDRIAISFERRILDRPLVRSDLAYHSLIKRYLSTSKAEIDQSLIDEVRREVARQMELGACSLENVARGMKTSTRSLQRQLRDERTTFGTLVDEWRRNRALALVAHTRLPLSEVSGALGYAEQSVFTKAFRRWYGDTPLRYRSGRDTQIKAS